MPHFAQGLLLQRLAQSRWLTCGKAFQQRRDFEVTGDAVMHFVSVAGLGERGWIAPIAIAWRFGETQPLDGQRELHGPGNVFVDHVAPEAQLCLLDDTAPAKLQPHVVGPFPQLDALHDPVGSSQDAFPGLLSENGQRLRIQEGLGIIGLEAEAVAQKAVQLSLLGLLLPGYQ